MTSPREIAETAAARIRFARPLPEPVVEDFINERPRYIAELQQCPAGSPAYERLAGHAEARRHLATALGLTVPHELGDTTRPGAGVSGATLIRPGGKS